jgi:hypothetical protein
MPEKTAPGKKLSEKNTKQEMLEAYQASHPRDRIPDPNYDCNLIKAL